MYNGTNQPEPIEVEAISVAPELHAPVNPGGPFIGVPEFREFPNLFVRQTRRGCCYELLSGCQARSEFFIGTIMQPKSKYFYAIEDSELLERVCFQNLRPWKMKVYQGPGPNQSGNFVEYHRECNLGPSPCKCCCFQEVSAFLRSGQHVGSVQETFYWCIPNFAVKNASGLHEYNLHIPMCFGCLPDICREGCCRYPFYLYPANQDGEDISEQEVGKIVKVWSGAFQELLTDADNFELHFPPDMREDQKANLLGAVFLINQLYFEGGQNE